MAINLFSTLTSLTGPITQIGASVKSVQSIFGKTELERASDAIDTSTGYTTQGLRQAANSTLAAANFNNQLDRINTQRRVDAQARQTSRVLSTNRAISATSGFSVTSQSFLMIANEQIAAAERGIRMEAADLENRQNMNIFEAKQRAASLETQARGVETSAAAARAKRQSAIAASRPSLLDRVQTVGKATESIGGALGSIGSLF